MLSFSDIQRLLMNSDGERIDLHVQLVRLLMERDGVTAEDAVALAGVLIPIEDHDAVLDRWRQQTSVRIEVLDPINISELGVHGLGTQIKIRQRVTIGAGSDSSWLKD